jgi:predicted GNAT family N-acyltransferase
MMFSDWHEEVIARHHDRSGFDCGEAALNDYLQKHARKNHERGASKTILAIGNNQPHPVLGYYSLSPASIAYERTPEVLRRGLGRYEIAGFRLGRLAISASMQGQGLGGQLLLSAARRCILAANEVGGVLLVIDAKNQKVADWYQSYGAIPLDDAPLCLVLPLATVATLLQSQGKL